MKVIKIGAMWCPGCLVMNPRWDKVADKYPKINQMYYDYDIDEEVIKRYEVGTILPVAIIFDDNDNEIKRFVGEISLDDIYSFFDDYDKTNN